MTAPASPLRVVIGLPTFRRPERLGRLLDSLPSQIAEAESAHPVTISITVVDNDPAGSAEQTAAGHAVRYERMPHPGLSAVRNAAIDTAGDADALVFIDDDEVPAPGWLTALVGAWLESGADFVSGAVTSVFEGDLDPWITAGGFFTRVRFDDGERMRFAATNNLLIDLRFVRAHDLRFDPAFAFSGGEDIRFTSQAVALGARIVACPAARVLDPVPPDRTTRQWVLQRAFRVGTTTVRGDLAGRRRGIGRLPARMKWMVSGLGRIVAGALRWVFGAVTANIVHRARGARLIARGAGMTAGALGVHYKEYRARHTRET